MTPDRPRPLRFRPPWWAFLLATIGCAGGIALGHWQAGRAAEKRAAAREAKAPVELKGRFLPAHTMFLANRIHEGRPGFHVLQPFRTESGGAVLVLRGWTPVGPDGRPPPVRTPDGAVSIEGTRLPRLARALEPPGAAHEGPLRQNVTVDEFAAWAGVALAPYVLQQRGGAEDGLRRDWPPADAGAEKNDSYSLQWYSLALLSVILLLVLNVRREPRS